MADYNYASGGFPTTPVTNDTLIINGTSYIYNGSAWEVVGGAGEGTSILSTGETGAVKYLREDGDGTSSWQAVAGGGIGEFKSTSIAISSDGTALANDDGTDNNNIGIGTNSGNDITSGYGNIGIGKNTLAAVTTAYENIAIGHSCSPGVTGARNIALGSFAGGSITSSTSNISIGYSALRGFGVTTTGSYNTVIGHESGYVLSTGTYNTLQGHQAGYALTTGAYNIINGHRAGYALTTGSSCVLLGQDAGLAITNETLIAIGKGSGQHVEGGTGPYYGRYNIFIGEEAGKHSRGGGSNTVIGYQALQSAYTSNNGMSKNVALGFKAGSRGAAAKEGSVCIGYEAGYGRSSGISNKLHIANNATESLIEGDFSAKTVNINGAFTVNGAAVGGGPTLYAENPVSGTTVPTAAADSLAIGHTSTTTGSYSVSIGYSATTADNSVALGPNAIAGGYSVAIGNNASCNTMQSVAIGNSTVGGYGAAAVGYTANSSGNFSAAIGYRAISAGVESVALGDARAGGTNSFAACINNNTSSYGASGTSSTAIGINAKAYSNYAVAIGWGAQAGNRACTFGGYNSIAGDNAGCLNTYSSSIVNAYSTGVGGLYASDHSIQGRFVLASADSLGGLGASQTSHYMVTGVTTNATQYTITGNSATTINGGNLMKIAPKSASTFSINIVAKQQGTSTNTAAWKIEGLIRQEANAAATTLVSSNLTVISNVPGWGDPVVVANTAHGALEVKVTGAASTNIKWGATIWSTEIIYT